jgi:hypothetical protein
MGRPPAAQCSGGPNPSRRREPGRRCRCGRAVGCARERHRLTPDTGDRGDRYQSTVFAAVTLPHHPYSRKVPVKVSVKPSPVGKTQKSPWPRRLA